MVCAPSAVLPCLLQGTPTILAEWGVYEFYRLIAVFADNPVVEVEWAPTYCAIWWKDHVSEIVYYRMQRDTDAVTQLHPEDRSERKDRTRYTGVLQYWPVSH